jgi:hypothetical protein
MLFEFCYFISPKKKIIDQTAQVSGTTRLSPISLSMNTPFAGGVAVQAN